MVIGMELALLGLDKKEIIMKRIFLVLFCIILVSITFYGCDDEMRIQETTATTEMQSQTTSSMESEIILPPLPIHPEEIQLMTDNYMEDYFPFSFTRRTVFYTLPGFIESLVDDPEAVAFVNEYIQTMSGPMDSPNEMPLMVFLRELNVPKEDFVRELDVIRQGRIERGVDLTSERWELPCPDIIFTFDNQIINAFYRRENPVAPDWWPVVR